MRDGPKGEALGAKGDNREEWQGVSDKNWRASNQVAAHCKVPQARAENCVRLGEKTNLGRINVPNAVVSRPAGTPRTRGIKEDKGT